MFASLGADFYFLELKCGLFLFCLLFFLGCFILVATIIHYFTNRGGCVWRNFHQVKAKIIGNGDGFVGRDYTNLISVRVDYSDLFCPYIPINIYSISSGPICMFRNSYTRTSLAIICWLWTKLKNGNNNFFQSHIPEYYMLSITRVGSKIWNI